MPLRPHPKTSFRSWYSGQSVLAQRLSGWLYPVQLGTFSFQLRPQRPFDALSVLKRDLDFPLTCIVGYKNFLFVWQGFRLCLLGVSCASELCVSGAELSSTAGEFFSGRRLHATCATIDRCFGVLASFECFKGCLDRIGHLGLGAGLLITIPLCRLGVRGVG